MRTCLNAFKVVEVQNESFLQISFNEWCVWAEKLQVNMKVTMLIWLITLNYVPVVIFQVITLQKLWIMIIMNNKVLFIVLYFINNEPKKNNTYWLPEEIIMLSRNLLQGIINHYTSNAMAHVHAICNFHILMTVSTKKPIKSLLDLVCL